MDSKDEKAAGEAEVKKETHDIDYADPEEDEKVKASGLKDVAKVTGMEGEVCIYKHRLMMYRFSQDQWKERGVGNAKLLRNDKDLKIRFAMRQEKTLKPVANFNVTEAPSCILTKMNNNEKAWTWACYDFSDNDSGVLSKLAARFKTVDDAKAFKDAIEAAQLFNDQAKAGKPKEELVFADVIEDVDEVVEDDIDTNKTADADGE